MQFTPCQPAIGVLAIYASAKDYRDQDGCLLLVVDVEQNKVIVQRLFGLLPYNVEIVEPYEESKSVLQFFQADDTFSRSTLESFAADVNSIRT